MQSRFNQLVQEQVNVLTASKKLFYPKTVKFSENFLKAFKEEFLNQKKIFSENSKGKSFAPQGERILKAMRFHMHEWSQPQSPPQPIKEAPVREAKTRTPQDLQIAANILKRKSKSYMHRGYHDFEGQRDMESMFQKDRVNLDRIAGLIASGKLEQAARVFDSLDTAVREEVPREVLRVLYPHTAARHRSDL